MFPKKSRPDWPALEFRKKKKLYSDYGNLFFVSPSKWLANCTQQSLLTREKPVFNIPNVIDARFFKSIDKKIARDIINLNTEEYVLAFGAVSISSPYKGWTELQKALKTLSEDRTFKRITILIFGSGYNKEIEDGIPFKTVFMGFLKDEYSTSLVYNAADIFVTPSLADNLPTTILESLSCGTPVVGFDIGGIPDMIRHKENGYLAKYKDSGDIANGIRYCLNNKIKGYLLPEFAKDTIVRQHIDLMNFCKIKLNNQSGNDKEF